MYNRHVLEAHWWVILIYQSHSFLHHVTISRRKGTPENSEVLYACDQHHSQRETRDLTLCLYFVTTLRSTMLILAQWLHSNKSVLFLSQHTYWFCALGVHCVQSASWNYFCWSFLDTQQLDYWIFSPILQDSASMYGELLSKITYLLGGVIILRGSKLMALSHLLKKAI